MLSKEQQQTMVKKTLEQYEIKRFQAEINIVANQAIGNHQEVERLKKEIEQINTAFEAVEQMNDEVK